MPESEEANGPVVDGPVVPVVPVVPAVRRSNSPCAMEGCERDAVSAGPESGERLCHTHYMREWRAQDSEVSEALAEQVAADGPAERWGCYLCEKRADFWVTDMAVCKKHAMFVERWARYVLR